MISIHSSFNVSTHATVRFNAGADAVTLSSSGEQFLISAKTFDNGVRYSCFSASIRNILDAQAGLTSTVSFNHDSGQLSIDFGETINWSCGSTMRDVTGFPRTFTGSVLTASFRPYYIINTTLADRSNFSLDYEPKLYERVSLTDTGYPSCIPRLSSAVYQDWTHWAEPKAAVFSADALTASVPFTWQHFYQHARSYKPFAVYQDGVRLSYNRLRADKSNFKPRMMYPGYDGEWIILMETQKMP